MPARIGLGPRGTGQRPGAAPGHPGPMPRSGNSRVQQVKRRFGAGQLDWSGGLRWAGSSLAASVSGHRPKRQLSRVAGAGREAPQEEMGMISPDSLMVSPDSPQIGMVSRMALPRFLGLLRGSCDSLGVRDDPRARPERPQEPLQRPQEPRQCHSYGVPRFPRFSSRFSPGVPRFTPVPRFTTIHHKTRRIGTYVEGRVRLGQFLPRPATSLRNAVTVQIRA